MNPTWNLTRFDKTQHYSKPFTEWENSTCLSDSLKVIVLTSIISQQNSYIEKDKDCAILGFWRIYVVLLSMYM